MAVKKAFRFNSGHVMWNKRSGLLSEGKSALYRGATKVVNSRIGRSTMLYSGSFLIQIMIQFGYFLLMVRVFDVTGYGIFSSVMAITFFLSNFVGWGCERVLIQRVSVNHGAFPDYFGHSIVSILLTGPIVFIVAYVLVESIAGNSLKPLALTAIILADTVCLKIAFVCGSCYMAFDNTKRHIAISIGMMFVKLFTLMVAWLTIPGLTLNGFASLYVLSSLVYGIFALALVTYELGRPNLRFFPSEWRLGLLYSLESATLSGMKDLDKPIVLTALGAEASGYYAAAFRIVDAAAAPLMGLLYATYTGYFKNASTRLSGGIDFGLRVLPYGIAVSAAISVFLLGAASFLPLILGAKFSHSVPLVQILCIFPILRMANGIGSDILRAINLQSLRVALMIASTMLVMPACWIGIQLGGLKGGVIAVVSIHMLIAICVWTVVLRMRLVHTAGSVVESAGSA